mmetsp:Transcript_8752/g.21359  ORF Transcript_8752/g.21359 Transcript_8752/m.21359 type:complete len:245 (+) Transcript_8752:235-969(+)
MPSSSPRFCLRSLNLFRPHPLDVGSFGDPPCLRQRILKEFVPRPDTLEQPLDIDPAKRLFALVQIPKFHDVVILRVRTLGKFRLHQFLEGDRLVQEVLQVVPHRAQQRKVRVRLLERFGVVLHQLVPDLDPVRRRCNGIEIHRGPLLLWNVIDDLEIFAIRSVFKPPLVVCGHHDLVVEDFVVDERNSGSFRTQVVFGVFAGMGGLVLSENPAVKFRRDAVILVLFLVVIQNLDASVRLFLLFV